MFAASGTIIMTNQSRLWSPGDGGVGAGAGSLRWEKAAILMELA